MLLAIQAHEHEFLQMKSRKHAPAWLLKIHGLRSLWAYRPDGMIVVSDRITERWEYDIRGEQDISSPVPSVM